MTSIEQRKRDHIDIVLRGDARHHSGAGFDAVSFEHNALPELNLADINLCSAFLGHRLRLPYLASSMTGGPERAAGINRAIAEAAQHLGFAMGVGSQRVALGGGQSHGIDASLRKIARDVPLFANLGAVQLVHGMGVDDARRAIDAIEADALILHLNPVQEALQPEGDHDWRGVEKAIADLVRRIDAPVIVKEVGFGISVQVARRLARCGVAAIDVAGAGGTSWSAVEGQRLARTANEQLGETFRNWGISTARCLTAVRNALPDMPLIASGGIQTGLDGAKAIRLGASLAGQAGALLKAAVEGPEAVIRHVELWSRELRIACFATGSRDLAALRSALLLQT
jgi:isopentenyl-diphosphate delta-isomerase